MAFVVSQGKVGYSIKCGLFFTILLLSARGYGQNSKILPEWKNHFTATPVISNCVFKRRIYDPLAPDKEELDQFRFQANAFMLREIQSLDEAASNHTAILNVYAGRFGRNYWAIEPRDILLSFPNAERIMKERKNLEAAKVYFSESRVYSALYYGINGLDPTTVKWQEENKFTALSTSGESLAGVILENLRGLPTLLEWHFEERSGTHYILEYGYDQQLGLSYYPSEIRLYWKEGKTEKALSAIHKILLLNTSSIPLGEEMFNATNYLATPAANLVFTNNDLYAVDSGGTTSKVLPANAMPLDVPDRKATTTFRVLIGSFLALSLIAPLLIWKRFKNNNTNKRKNQ